MQVKERIRIVALTGMPGSRKTLLGRKLGAIGYRHITLSQYIREALSSQGRPLSPDEYWRESRALRSQFGDEALVSRAWQDILTDNTNMAVIDSVRSLKAAVYLSERAEQFYLVAVQAPIHLRRHRLIETVPTFFSDEEKCIQLDSQELEQGIGSVLAMSDHILSITDDLWTDLDAYLTLAAKLVHDLVSARYESITGETYEVSHLRGVLNTLDDCGSMERA
jgi:dephospho-CoA kinase